MDSLYVHYHDTDWACPSTTLVCVSVQKLILDGFQAGLSWITILRKRHHFRAVFDNFDAEKIARYDARKVAALMNDPGIVRNRLKIDAAVTSAQAYLEMPDFSAYLWGFLMAGRCRTVSAAWAMSRPRRRWLKKSPRT